MAIVMGSDDKPITKVEMKKVVVRFDANVVMWIAMTCLVFALGYLGYVQYNLGRPGYPLPSSFEAGLNVTFIFCLFLIGLGLANAGNWKHFRSDVREFLSFGFDDSSKEG